MINYMGMEVIKMIGVCKECGKPSVYAHVEKTKGDLMRKPDEYYPDVQIDFFCEKHRPL